MANAAGNMIFVEAADDPISFPIKNIRVLGILVHCTHAANPAIITLGDNVFGTSYPTVIDFEVAAAAEYQHLDFSNSPLVFPNGIRVKVLTDASITIIFERNIANGG